MTTPDREVVARIIRQHDTGPCDSDFLELADRILAAVSGWRSVDKNPPPINGAPGGRPPYVLITRWPCSGMYGVAKAFQRKDRTWWHSGNRRAFIPTHWQPLPAPPEWPV